MFYSTKIILREFKRIVLSYGFVLWNTLVFNTKSKELVIYKTNLFGMFDYIDGHSNELFLEYIYIF